MSTLYDAVWKHALMYKGRRIMAKILSKYLVLGPGYQVWPGFCYRAVHHGYLLTSCPDLVIIVSLSSKFAILL